MRKCEYIQTFAFLHQIKIVQMAMILALKRFFRMNRDKEQLLTNIRNIPGKQKPYRLG